MEEQEKLEEASPVQTRHLADAGKQTRSRVSMQMLPKATTGAQKGTLFLPCEICSSMSHSTMKVAPNITQDIFDITKELVRA